MTRAARSPYLLVALMITTPGPLDGQRIPEHLIWGRAVELSLTNNERVNGELLAIAPDTVWLLGEPNQLMAVPIPSVERARVRMHGVGSKTVAIWTALGAALTGAGMTIACNRVEGTECSGVFPAFAVSWGIVGGLAALSLVSSSRRDVSLEADEARLYARFPQGLPDGFMNPPPPPMRR